MEGTPKAAPVSALEAAAGAAGQRAAAAVKTAGEILRGSGQTPVVGEAGPGHSFRSLMFVRLIFQV